MNQFWKNMGMQGNITYDLGDVLDGSCDVYKATTTVKLASNLSVLWRGRRGHSAPIPGFCSFFLLPVC